MRTTEDILKKHLPEETITAKEIESISMVQAQEIFLGKRDLTPEQKEEAIKSVESLNNTEAQKKEMVKYIKSCGGGYARNLTSEQRNALECFSKFTNTTLSNSDNSKLTFIIYALCPHLPSNTEKELMQIIRDNRPVILKKMKCNWFSKTEEIRKYILLLLEYKILLFRTNPSATYISPSKSPLIVRNGNEKELYTQKNKKNVGVGIGGQYSLTEGITDLFGCSCEDIYNAVLECKRQGFFTKKKISVIFDCNIARKF